MRASIVILPLLFALAGCSKPLPPDRSDYAGRWSAPNVVLVIGKNGNVAYKRMDGKATRTINAPIQAFDGPSFSVGVGPLSTTFVVTAIPHPDGGAWKMTVDGVELTRGEKGDAGDAEQTVRS